MPLPNLYRLVFFTLGASYKYNHFYLNFEVNIEPLEYSLQSNEKLIYLQKHRVLWIRDLQTRLYATLRLSQL